MNDTTKKPSMLSDLLQMNKCLSMFKAILTTLPERCRLKCARCLVKLGGFVKRNGHFNSKVQLQPRWTFSPIKPLSVKSVLCYPRKRCMPLEGSSNPIGNLLALLLELTCHLLPCPTGCKGEDLGQLGRVSEHFFRFNMSGRTRSFFHM